MASRYSNYATTAAMLRLIMFLNSKLCVSVFNYQPHRQDFLKARYVYIFLRQRPWQLQTRQFPIVNNTNMTATRICEAGGTLQPLLQWWNCV